ncbi:hypothetical protein [Sphingomonas abaci]|uniref:Uncharacterized protein n=1 Tax=Sphingomonas abaci TaxID=237611 RepID=A0A7W7EX28_9SPHN|nr:hypothetical protein [Sphingomonas abaci]MBB4616696.1 hypothetical protein [Sphingomonas abaci]
MAIKAVVEMIYLQAFVGAAATTALILVLARLILRFLLSGQKQDIPALCVGLGYLIGHFSFNGSPHGPDAVIRSVQFVGSAVCLVLFAAGARHIANRTN